MLHSGSLGEMVEAPKMALFHGCSLVLQKIAPFVNSSDQLDGDIDTTFIYKNKLKILKLQMMLCDEIGPLST